MDEETKHEHEKYYVAVGLITRQEADETMGLSAEELRKDTPKPSLWRPAKKEV